MRETKSTCCYCGVGCGVVIESEGDRIIGVRGDAEHPANFGRLCTKGATLHLSARLDNRALYPEVRAERAPPRRRASWDEALNLAATRFAHAVRTHGPDSVAFYISGQLLTEDYYVFNKLSKGLIGTNNIDTNSRLCMSSAVAGYKATLGADAPPTCYEDVAHARCIFIAGSNMAVAHPILFRRIEDQKARRPDLKLIVVDPRRTDTAAFADLHLPILPGTDIALYNGMLHVLLWEGLCDMAYVRAHTEGFDALKQTLRDYTPDAVARLCGVAAADIVQAAKWFGQSAATLSMYCQGLNQSTHGTDNNAALINLHLATAHIGKPGAGPFSLTGQPNAMGGREVGGLSNLLSAHRDMANAEHRAEVARLWGIDDVPATPGKSAVEMFEAVRRGEIRAIWIACTNPAQSMPDLNSVRAALEKAEFVVVQEAYANTDTVAYADVLLPASTWGEKTGTVTNSERRITRVRPAVLPPGEARHDWQIVVDFAHRLGRTLGDERASALFPYRNAEQIFNEHRESTRGRDLDITGLSYDMLEHAGPQQWPLPEGATTGKARLYSDGIYPTPDGRARFVNTKHRPTAEDTDARYPIQTTGRLRDQWHGMSRTGTVARLFNHVAEPQLSMNPDDMRRRGLRDGDIVEIRSRRGGQSVRVVASADMRAAQAFMPMHWGGQFMHGIGVNALMPADFDPMSRQPELKHAAIQVAKLSVVETLVAMRRFTSTSDVSALELMRAMQPYLSRFDYATLGLAGRENEVLVFRAYGREAIDLALLSELDALLELDDVESTMRYMDVRRGVFKAARVEGDSVTVLRLCGETAAQEWVRNMMIEGASAEAVRPWILAPISTPPRGTLDRGRTVCACIDVSENEILAQLLNGATFTELQATLKCGTQCGSCVPEVRRMCESVSSPESCAA